MNKYLIDKYNVPGPRYTSYPTVPHWNKQGITTDTWIQSIKKIHSEKAKDGISIYIHLPYCENLCTFCGCHKHITKRHEVEDPYIDAVIKEWQLYLSLFEEPPLIKEIHLGGGTPTFFSPDNLAKLVASILSTSRLHDESELGFEGHPNNTTKEHLQQLYQIGFRRVSFGVQDYNPQIQKAINRIQPFENVSDVNNLARKIGYTSISNDLVYGLPHQTKDHILETIYLTTLLKPDRISLYGYAHVPWVKGVGQRGYNDDDIPKGEDKRALYECAKEALLNAGYFEIGMDHFAQETDPLFQALENKKLHRNFMGYTTNTTPLMIGLGMSAIGDSWYGFAQNVKTVKEYIDHIQKGQFPVFKGHELSEEELTIRRHILNLMCFFETSWDNEFISKPYFQDILNRLQPLQKDELVILNDHSLSVTETGKLFIRNICMCFDLNLHAATMDKPTFSSTI